MALISQFLLAEPQAAAAFPWGRSSRLDKEARGRWQHHSVPLLGLPASQRCLLNPVVIFEFVT